MSFSSAALFKSTTADKFQEKTGQRGSAANFFLTQERQYKKEASLAHGIRGPSRSHHLLGASSPTPKDFQGETGQRGSAAIFFLAQECQSEKEAAIAHGIRGLSRSHHLLGGASSPTPEDFQGETGQRGSAADFFSAQKCQYVKEAAIAHGIRGLSRSHHLPRAASPTPERRTGQDASAGQDASVASCAGPPYDFESDKDSKAKDVPEDTMGAANHAAMRILANNRSIRRTMAFRLAGATRTGKAAPSWSGIRADHVAWMRALNRDPTNPDAAINGKAPERAYLAIMNGAKQFSVLHHLHW
jgi:hypothetical protein